MTDTQKIHQFAEQNMLVERYLLGELGGLDLEDFERHMWECSICFDQVKAGQALTANISGAGVAPRRGSMQWQRIVEFFRRLFWKELAQYFPVLLAGMLIGAMLMAVLQRHAPKMIRRSVEDGNASSPKFPPAKVVTIGRREVRR